MSFYFDVGPFDEDRLYHDCPVREGVRDMSMQPKSVGRMGYDETGYYRGLRAGKSAWTFKDSPYSYNVIKCKACGEEFQW